MILLSHFYAITDPMGGHNPVELAKTLLEAGARIIQLRMKQGSSAELLAAAKGIHQLCRKHQALFIVNDRPDIALLAGAQGGHLGQKKLPVWAWRRLEGEGSKIGGSPGGSERPER